jgi:hypothetical protein
MGRKLVMGELISGGSSFRTMRSRPLQHQSPKSP